MPVDHPDSDITPRNAKLVYVFGACDEGCGEYTRSLYEAADAVERTGHTPIVLDSMISTWKLSTCKDDSEWDSICADILQRCDVLVYTENTTPSDHAIIDFAEEIGVPVMRVTTFVSNH